MLALPADRPASVTFAPFQLLWARLKAFFPTFQIHFFDLSVDISVPTVAAVSVKQKGSGPSCLYAVASRPLAERATFSALKDFSSWRNTNPETYPLHATKISGCARVGPDADDHRAFYSLDETFGRRRSSISTRGHL